MTTTLYESYITGDDTNYGTGDETDYGGMGQTFTTTKRQTVEYTSLKLRKGSGATGTVYFRIYKANSSHLPTGSVLATSDGIDVSSLDYPTATWKTVTFASQPTLEKFTEYAIITTNPLGAINVGWRYAYTGTYSNGKVIYSDTDNPNWIVRSVSTPVLMFSEYGSPAFDPPSFPFALISGGNNLGPNEGGVEGTDWRKTGEDFSSTIKRLVAITNSKVYYEST